MSEPTAPSIRLPKLPKRTPIKLTIALAPNLHERLSEYREAYHQAYGEDETLAELIPYMLASFIESDRAFGRTHTRHRKVRAESTGG